MTETSFEMLERRSLLISSGRVPDSWDRMAWAELCLRDKLRAPARALFESAFIGQGFSSQLRREQARIAERTGLWPDEAPPRASRPAGEGTIRIAVTELRTLGGALAAGLARAFAARRSPTMAETLPHGTSFSRRGAIDAPATEVADALNGIYRSLSAAALPEDWSAAEAMMTGLRAASERVPSFDCRMFGGAPLPLLANAISFAGLQEFLYDNQDLIFEPYGSAECLHRAARLDSAGLGPFFGNVQRLARKSRDIFELAYVAADAAEDAGVKELGYEPWMVLLSRELSGPLLYEVVDDLGDLGEISILSAIFHRTVRRPKTRIDKSLIMRLRDAALDNLNYDLAARAQLHIVEQNPDVLLERQILGSIDASAGRIAAAEESFAACLAMKPKDKDIIERLVALRAHEFGPYTIGQGFGSPHDRQLTRLRQRTGLAVASGDRNVGQPLGVELTPANL